MIRRLLLKVVKAAGVVLLVAVLLWFLPLMLPEWIKNPPEMTARKNKKHKKRKRWEHWKKFCKWEAKEKRERFKRIEKKRANFYK